ncbi:hypothetical protein [Tahibacter sp.]|uniref:hypothetical protein n=1 Tax=Tahibacter sp. TaxID=2056211 RepID=UPI0028C3D041|nr:hypothetical protein [Tahibacter sp.]
MAHSKTQDVSIELISGARRGHASHWPSLCDRDTAERFSDDVERIIKDFPERVGISMPRESQLSEQVEEQAD